MTYTKINLYLANGIPETPSNLWYGSDSAVVEIRMPSRMRRTARTF